ncbi:MAG: hypothetical protein HZA91_19660 [Verrucomicrobia bacterium]|nr:hypothetical protein [Verrucomicrobiota bacterium]
MNAHLFYQWAGYLYIAGLLGWVILRIFSKWGLTLIEAIVIMSVFGVLAGQHLKWIEAHLLLVSALIILFAVSPYVLLALFLKKRAKQRREQSRL